MKSSRCPAARPMLLSGYHYAGREKMRASHLGLNSIKKTKHSPYPRQTCRNIKHTARSRSLTLEPTPKPSRKSEYQFRIEVQGSRLQESHGETKLRKF